MNEVKEQLKIVAIGLLVLAAIVVPVLISKALIGERHTCGLIYCAGMAWSIGFFVKIAVLGK